MNKKIFKSLPVAEEEMNHQQQCGRGNCPNLATALHTCPFSSEINGDDDTLCDCCEDCEHECAMDI